MPARKPPRRAESQGLGDQHHIVEPIDIHAHYPYSESGEFPASSRGERHEQLTAIAYLAAKTSRLKFLTSVMVVPHRPVRESSHARVQLAATETNELRRWEAIEAKRAECAAASSNSAPARTRR